jgi:hypothetical protein
MNRPSSTITAAGMAGFIAATLLTLLKIFVPETYALVPPDYQGHLIVAITFVIGYFKKEKVLNVQPRTES